MAVRSATSHAVAGARSGNAAHAANWREIERLVLVRIANGSYASGERIPTCQEFATEYGANKNTVHRAYRSLVKRGYLRSVAGMGTFVTRKMLHVDAGAVLEEVRQLVALAAEEAQRAGLDADSFEALVHEIVRGTFRGAAPRIGFVECNKGDAARLSREMQAALKHPVQPLLINEVLDDPARYVHDFDLLVVNLSHLATLEAGLRLFVPSGEAKVFGLHVGIDPQSLTQIARLPERMRVGIICDLEQSLSMLTGTVLGLNPTLVLGTALSGAPTKVANVIKRSEVLLATQSALSHLDPGTLAIPVIALQFQANERSMLDVAQQIARLRAAPPRHPAPGKHDPVAISTRRKPSKRTPTIASRGTSPEGEQHEK